MVVIKEQYIIPIGKKHIPNNSYDMEGWDKLKRNLQIWCNNYKKNLPNSNEIYYWREDCDMNFTDKRMAMAFKLAWG